MVAVFLLLTYMAMQVISVGLVNRVQSAFIRSTQSALQTQLRQIILRVHPAVAGQVESLVQQQLVPSSVNLVLVNREGEKAYPGGLPSADPPSQAVESILAARKSIICPRPAARAALVWCVAPVSLADGQIAYALAASTPLSGIYQSIQSASGTLLSWTLIALIVIGGLSLFVARSITEPIGALTRRARAMAAGDFSTRLPVQSHDEVGQLAQMFNHLGRRLQETEAVRKEIVANVSHELRTPITTIKLYTESLLDWGLDDPVTARPKLEVIAAETDRMVGLIGDLLDLSRFDHRGVLRSRKRTDVAQLALSVVTSQQPRAARKGVVLTVHHTEMCEAVIDPDRIVQVLSNLVTNAIDFTSEGGTVSVNVAHGDGLVSVDVTDTGIGIPPEDLPRIFDRFYRVDASRSREHGGSGLGLAIAREIVEAHGGEIHAVSEQGRGTRIRFTLPFSGGPQQ